jgi:hypothetical protein
MLARTFNDNERKSVFLSPYRLLLINVKARWRSFGRSASTDGNAKCKAGCKSGYPPGSAANNEKI